MHRQAQAQRARTLGMLLRGGIPSPQSMKMVAGLLSAQLAAALERARIKVTEGIPLSVAFEREGLSTPVALRMLRVGERAGNMGEMLERAAGRMRLYPAPQSGYERYLVSP